MPEKYDVIIIGAGIGGLTAGAILSKNGKKVLVLEKNPVPGGYAVNFKRGGFEFDASLHMIDGCDQGQGTYKVLEKCDVLSKIQLLKPPFLYRSIYPDFDIRVSQNDPKGYMNLLGSHFPHERINIGRLFKEMSGIFYETRKFLYSKIPPSLQLPIFPFLYPKLFHYANKSTEEMLHKYTKDHRLKAIIAQLWGYYALPPSKMSPFYFAYGWHDYLHNGGYYLKGGGRSLTNAFVKVIKESGGEIVLHCEVKKIIVENNIVHGVIDNKGNALYSKCVISNIDIRKTFNELIGNGYLPDSFLRKVNSTEPSVSAFIVYLGISVNLANKGIKDYEIFYNPSYDLDRQLVDCINNDMDRALFLVTIYSNIDSGFAPPGKSIVEIMTLAGYDFWEGMSKDEYEKKKEELAQKLIKRVETIIPGLSSYIETIEIATPITMERYTGNYKGSIYGASQLVSQSGMKRVSQKTPIKSLYLVGAWTMPGEGISGVVHSGEHIAEHIIKTLK